MVSPAKLRAACAGLAALALLCPSARALVSLNDGTDRFYVTTTAAMAYDSNIFAHAGGAGDYIYSAGLLFEYTRRAGFIGVNASMALNASRFGSHTDENFNDPKFAAEFIKSGGRTTGKLSLLASRESEADALANVRTQSWLYDAALDFKYPVIERYSISGNFDYSDRIYDETTTALANLRTYTAGADLLYALTSDRNFLAGYQYRHSETSTDTTFGDQSFTVGVNGKIIPKLTGSLRAGYEIRSPLGSTTDGDYKGLTASALVTWTLTSKFNLTGQLAKDVSVTSNDLSVNTVSTGLTAQYVLNDRVSLSGNTGTGESRFLGQTGGGRRDVYFTWGAGLKYKITEHLDSSLAYLYDENWSTFSYSDFIRQTVTVTLSSRW